MMIFGRKRSLFFLLLFLFGFGGISYGQGSCTLEIEPEMLVVDGDELDIEPGATVCLKAGEKDYLLIQNVHGTEENPVTFINSGGRVVINTDHYFGIKIAHSSFIKFSGHGDENIPYGIYVKRVGQGAGLAVGDLSTDVEVEFLEISNTAIAGVYAKTDPTCNDFSSTRDKFTMYNFVMHDCYLHDINDEGFYVGSSKYTGQTLYDCDTVVLPHVLVGTRIYNNIVENTGWDGIQVSSAETDCKVYNNTVKQDSYEEHPGQMSGILIGGGSRCQVFNNTIIDGKGDGIDLFGLGSQEVFNNLIIRPGKTFTPNDPNQFKHGIYLGKVQDATAAGELNKIFNNTIISPKSFGITYSNDVNEGKVFNNAILNPGYANAGNQAFVNVMGNSEVTVENNFADMDVYAARFISVSGDNYDLQPSSPCVNQGKDLSQEGVDFDILGRNRPYENKYDIGAYECQLPSGILTHDNQELFRIMPNPATNVMHVKSESKVRLKQIRIFDMNGKLWQTNDFVKNKKSFSVDISALPVGRYLVVIRLDNGDLSTVSLMKK